MLQPITSFESQPMLPLNSNHHQAKDGVGLPRAISRRDQVILREKALFTIPKPNRFDVTDEDALKCLKDAPPDGVSQFLLLKSNAEWGFSDLTHAFLSNHFTLVLPGELKPHHNTDVNEESPTFDGEGPPTPEGAFDLENEG
ncbi:hypothetical protein PENSUB_4969 [Penicillium subrubescens]|uniref:Uncharacterized protein n=2 Tax=Penicillium subrubescens TaxID=1316194 RepID=A0A1Q5UB42_9EURO|nr:hypothetical protein PENSUB_4969 [Penicillium subrubescens]